MTTGADHDVDYAEPAAVGSSRRRVRGDRGPRELWGGRPRTALKAGSWVLAGVLALVLLVGLGAAEKPGADTPREAVSQLLQGIADTDPVAIVASIDPREVEDPDRAGAAYDQLGDRLLRRGEVPPADVTAVLAAAESQLDGSADLDTVALLAAIDLELDDLRLRVDRDSGEARVYIVDGELDVSLDAGRLPDAQSGLGKASYSMPLAEGWERDGEPIEPFLVVVERDGRWFVSLESSADALLDGGVTS